MKKKLPRLSKNVVSQEKNFILSPRSGGAITKVQHYNLAKTKLVFSLFSCSCGMTAMEGKRQPRPSIEY